MLWTLRLLRELGEYFKKCGDLTYGNKDCKGSSKRNIILDKHFFVLEIHQYQRMAAPTLYIVKP